MKSKRLVLAELRKEVSMPIKDQQAKREYFRNYMANKRKSLTGKSDPNLLNLAENVKPTPEVLNPVKPDIIVKPLADVKPELVKSCPRCLQLKKQLQAVAELPTAYIENREAEIKEKHQKETAKLLAKIKELEEKLKKSSVFLIRP